jgi:hypothetical protein
MFRGWLFTLIFVVGFEANAQVSVADYRLFSGNFTRLQRFETQHIPSDDIYALINSYRSLFESRAGLIEQRDNWMAGLLSLLNEKIRQDDQGKALDEVSPALFALFPEDSYEIAKGKIAEALKKQSLQSLISKLDDLTQVDSPSDCPNFSLLNDPNAVVSLRRTDQEGGTCYANGAVKAMDYLNYSVIGSRQTTSYLVAALCRQGSRCRWD